MVLHVLYLIFNEGYAATAGPALQRGELAQEAIRLVRLVRALLPDDTEVAGLLALMLLTDARRPARTAADGSLVPMSEQDRTRWDADADRAKGVELVTEALPRGADRAVPAAGRDRRPARRGAQRSRRPTGPRSRPCTGCCCGSPTTRWSR